MTNAQFNAGTRSQPLGDPKAGVSADLDALAAYVASLNSFPSSPHRNADGTLSAAAVAGRALFQTKSCGSCHGGTAFTNSASNNPSDVGTIAPESGTRLGGPLTGIDIPTLRDAWATAPYLHRGSAATIEAAISAHDNVSASGAELADLAAYVAQIGSQETSAPGGGGGTTPNTGTGLRGQYFNNTTLTGAPVLERVEAVNFGWGTASPGGGVAADQFSVRWSGLVEATATGNFQFRTKVNDGVRLWVNGVLVIDNWSNRTTVAEFTSANIALTKNQRYAITLEYYDNTGQAVARLNWLRPGQTTFGAVPASRLYAN
jgi:mono/diheme cytochrome c family protein